MSILNDLSKEVTFNPECTPTIGALSGATLILDKDGNLHNLEELACQYDSKLEVLTLDQHGRLTITTAHSFRIGQWVRKTIRIVLDTNQVIEATPEQKLLSTTGWITVNEIKFGTVLSTAVYNPTTRYPSQTVAEVVHVRETPQDIKIPTYSFSVHGNHNNLLIAHEDEKGCIHLSPAHIGIPKTK